MEEAKSNKFCSLGNEAQFVGWFQIVRSIILGIWWALDSYLKLQVYKDNKSLFGDNTKFQQIYMIPSLTAISLLLLVLFALMGKLLLTASKENDHGRIRFWINYEIIAGFLWILIYTTAYLAIPTKHNTYSLQGLTVLLATEVCCVFFVSLHYREIKTFKNVTSDCGTEKKDCKSTKKEGFLGEEFVIIHL